MASWSGNHDASGQLGPAAGSQDGAKALQVPGVDCCLADVDAEIQKAKSRFFLILKSLTK